MEDLKVTIEISDLAGCTIEKENKSVQFEDLSRKEQIIVCNSFVQFYQLFSKVIKNEDEKD